MATVTYRLHAEGIGTRYIDADSPKRAQEEASKWASELAMHLRHPVSVHVSCNQRWIGTSLSSPDVQVSQQS